jgi:succinate dehydrogenase/fumarate reductase cytochrome b subunit
MCPQSPLDVTNSVYGRRVHRLTGIIIAGLCYILLLFTIEVNDINDY